MGQTTKRHQNRGLRKICGCPRRGWAKCPHSWHFNFKPKGGGPSYRFSVDSEAGKHIEGKTDAEALADGWRTAIRGGTFRRGDKSSAPVVTADAVTLESFRGTYVERRGKPLSANDAGCLRQLVAFNGLGATPLGAITTDTIEAFFEHLRSQSLAASTRNKYVQATKALFRWAVKKGYLQRSPVDSDTIKLETHAKRHRRLSPDVLNAKGQVEREGEERRLLAVAGPHLQRLIVAALETGCRRGELLSLTWRDVHMNRKEITVRAEITKTKTARILPISARLAAVIEMAQTALTATLRSGPAKELSDEALAAQVARCYVFGDAIGGKVISSKRAWETAVLKAHGRTPAWTAHNTLAPASRAALDAIDLHFHDLRHEAGSRFLEAGWPIHHVQHMLGHANLSQTSTYLNATRIGLQESMRRFSGLVVEQAQGSGGARNPSGPEPSSPTEQAPPLVN